MGSDDEAVGAGTGAAPAGEEPVAATFAKRRNRGANIRKRAAESDPAAGEPDEEKVNIQRSKAKKDGLTFSTASKKDKAVFNFEANRMLQQQTDQGATKGIETETEFDRDARALREQVLAQATGEAETKDGEYQGANNYIDYRKGFRREHTVGAEKGGGWHGPLRATTHIRSSVRFDYQPDICKDYKETGYCGYGDACKFMHDRGDYKSGWELERDWKQKQDDDKSTRLNRHRVDGDESEEDGDDEDDDLPFACFLCRRPWDEHSEPVVTRCQHYFCEQCALKHHAKNPRCFVCEVPTNGLFNVAKDILKKLKEDKKKAGN
mmetsp:Transcript_14513/g.40875  ORF Transcript_14513/g.40875 Transcript_14513/m.40875 type:complete len:321 (-) Transcript_14513:186-1148(-)